jgi:diketogulonate reductase-like aldo/keto reductase
MKKQTTDLTLNNRLIMPALGLGVFQSPPKETADAIQAAIETGYRLIDTAAAYMNEKSVGEDKTKGRKRKKKL